MQNENTTGQRVELRRRQIMTRAAALLRKRDYAGFSVDDLCKGLKINKTTFYRYFSTKEQLLFDLHQAHMNEVEAMLQSVLSSGDGAKDKLASMISGHVMLQQRPGVSSLTIPQLYVFSPKHRKEVLKRRDEYEAAMRMLIQQGVEEGVFRTCDVKMQSILILSTLNAVQNWYRESGKYSVSEIAEKILDAVFSGLLARGEVAPKRNGQTSSEGQRTTTAVLP